MSALVGRLILPLVRGAIGGHAVIAAAALVPVPGSKPKKSWLTARAVSGNGNRYFFSTLLFSKPSVYASKPALAEPRSRCICASVASHIDGRPCDPRYSDRPGCGEVS